MKVVLASNNAGKVKEFTELLAPFHIEMIPQSQLGVSEIEETGLSFIENAILKARHAAQVTGLPALADDSGLAVDALNGEPGIYSARYAGTNNSADNITKLLMKMANVPEEKRSAHFHCILAFVSHATDPMPLICAGKWSGYILSAPQGEHGFGYDPVFYVPAEKMSAAELPAELKNKISHRGLALELLLKQLPEKL
jgi:XTP/dITP diphosphohydrolase